MPIGEEGHPVIPGKPEHHRSEEGGRTHPTGVCETCIGDTHADCVAIVSKRTSDAELLMNYGNGDESAFTELVHRHEGNLLSYLRRRLGDAALAEDVAQATWLQVHRKWDQFDSEKKFCPWLFTIANHQAIDALRRKGRRKEVSFDERPADIEGDEPFASLFSDREQTPDGVLEERESREWIKDAVCFLPTPLQSVVVLAYYQGKKYREIADELSIPSGTVKSRLHQAVLRLRKAWNVWEGGDGTQKQTRGLLHKLLQTSCDPHRACPGVRTEVA